MLFALAVEKQDDMPLFLRYQNFTDLRKCLMKELIKADSCILIRYEKSFMKLQKLRRR